MGAARGREAKQSKAAATAAAALAAAPAPAPGLDQLEGGARTPNTTREKPDCAPGGSGGKGRSRLRKRPGLVPAAPGSVSDGDPTSSRDLSYLEKKRQLAQPAAGTDPAPLPGPSVTREPHRTPAPPGTQPGTQPSPGTTGNPTGPWHHQESNREHNQEPNWAPAPSGNHIRPWHECCHHRHSQGNQSGDISVATGGIGATGSTLQLRCAGDSDHPTTVAAGSRPQLCRVASHPDRSGTWQLWHVDPPTPQ